MKSLFPEMEKEIALDRVAERRELRQRAREYLRDKTGYAKWILSHIKKHGPTVDANLFLEMAELTDRNDVKDGLTVILVADAMWRLGKLWRKPFPNHPSGVQCYIYGVRGVHAQNTD